MQSPEYKLFTIILFICITISAAAEFKKATSPLRAETL